jgi:hypothetical protein
MAKIKNLRMWNDICNDARIRISKSLFGLKTTATYVRTQSVIDTHMIEYSPADGGQIKSILGSPKDELEKVIGDFHPKETPNGNYMLEVARSRDGQFIALLLQQFSNLSYEPVMKTQVFEGNAAQVISKLL